MSRQPGHFQVNKVVRQVSLAFAPDNASAVKEPSHFDVRKSSSQGTTLRNAVIYKKLSYRRYSAR